MIATPNTFDPHQRMDRLSPVYEVSRASHSGLRRLVKLVLTGPLASMVLASAVLAAPQGTESSCSSSNCLDAVTNPSPHDPSHPQWWSYVPPETTTTPHEMQHLSVFLPTGTPPPQGWPVIMHSNASNFQEPIAWCDGTRGAFTKLCDDYQVELMDLILNGWAVISVSTVGVNSNVVGQENNVFFGEGSTEWNDFNLFWAEKDVTWARQWIAENAATLNLDNDHVVVWGTSSGSVYAAWISLGPTRTFAGATSTQSQQDTRCAGYIGNLPLTWLPAYDDDYTAIHWPDVNGMAAAKMSNVAAGVLAEASPSTWIRAANSHALDTPVCILGDEVFNEYDFSRDGLGDPVLSNAFDPGIDPLHPSWFVLTMAEDLLGLDAAFHGIDSLFLLSDLVTDLASVSLPHSGYVDLIFTAAVTGNDAQLLRGHWLRRFTDEVAAGTTSRNGSGINTSCYLTSDVPIIGDDWTVDVDFTDQGGSGFWGVFGYSSPITFLLNMGQELLINPASPFVFSASGVSTGTTTSIDFPIPADPCLMGLPISTQAYTIGGSAGLLLCNALDLLLGY